MKNYLTLFLCLWYGTSALIAQGQNSLHFDGIDDYVSVSQSDFATGSDYTIEAWFRTDDLGTKQAILVGQQSSGVVNVTVEIHTDGTLRFLHRVPGGTSGGVEIFSTSVVDDNTWHHFAAVMGYDSKLRLYVDGTLEVTSGSSVSNVPSDMDLFIGILDNSGLTRPFAGEMDEIRLWSHALTLSEINESMDHEMEITAAGLAGYYTFDRGTAGGDNGSGCPGGSPCENSEPDQTGNGSNGILNNFALSGSASNYVAGVALESPYVAPAAANSLHFDGNNDNAVAYDLSFANGSDYTMEGWFNLSNVNTQQSLIAGTNSSNNHFLLIEVVNSTIRFLHRQPAGPTGGVNIYTPSSSPLSANAWHHFAAVRDTDNKLRLYLDGTMVVESAATVPDINSNFTLVIGSLLQSGDSRFANGFLDDLRFWSKARTATEIQADMSKKLNGDEASLETYYTFDRGVGNGDNGSGCGNSAPCRRNALDETVNRKTLQLNNFALSGTTSNFVAESVMPVEFTYFHAERSSGGNLLEWETAREEQNEGFDIERSDKRGQWQRIGFVPGAGNSTIANRYRYVDTHFSSGMVYYRLKQHDEDGHFAYSNVISIIGQTSTGETLSLYPNPTTGTVMLTHIAEATYRVTDYIGRTVKRGVVRSNMVELHELPKGVYLLSVNSREGVYTGKILKN
ncbi:LamG-like jellyroll fold domain-containing protein [Lewinella sp. JB7]|uniref:LamG-like jellyroll fold domain-containing protein n=1 Tax=Lewinella sp. JB7 TaxID=2962887 RepID=UPI0020C9C851|nr:LamG-like jellyroll fold domain-containing protein [Lewinella sp. JB7]MCP9236094.1 LamG domain-containing protein [Lewinella sp. JB7]